MNVVDEAAANAMYCEGCSLLLKNEKGALRLLDAAVKKCDDALLTSSKNAVLHHLRGKILYTLIANSERVDSSLVTKSIDSFEKSLSISPDNAAALFDYATLLAYKFDVTK
jgi:hypothetical protein